MFHSTEPANESIEPVDDEENGLLIPIFVLVLSVAIAGGAFYAYKRKAKIPVEARPSIVEDPYLDRSSVTSIDSVSDEKS